MNKQLLDILVCPKSGMPLEYNKDDEVLECKESGLVYSIVNGIPVLIEEEAQSKEKAQ